jgi:hypothetical protein
MSSNTNRKGVHAVVISANMRPHACFIHFWENLGITTSSLGERKTDTPLFFNKSKNAPLMQKCIKECTFFNAFVQ